MVVIDCREFAVAINVICARSVPRAPHQRRSTVEIASDGSRRAGASAGGEQGGEHRWFRVYPALRSGWKDEGVAGAEDNRLAVQLDGGRSVESWWTSGSQNTLLRPSNTANEPQNHALWTPKAGRGMADPAARRFGVAKVSNCTSPLPCVPGADCGADRWIVRLAWADRRGSGMRSAL